MKKYLLEKIMQNLKIIHNKKLINKQIKKN